MVRAFASLGVTKVRLTGGEPLLRRDLAVLVGIVAGTPGVSDVALTTNGSLLAAQADALKAAGLRRVTVSLDSLDPEVFRQMADTKIALATVLDGIAAAREAGLVPVKLNTVLRRGVNEHHLLDLVDYAREGGHLLRVIEFMDVGETNGWLPDEVVPAAEVLARVAAVHPLEPAGGWTAARSPSATGSSTARGELGPDHQRHQAVLRRLHAGPAVRGGRAVHLPVLLDGDGPAGGAARRGRRRSAVRRRGRALAGPRRQLQRGPGPHRPPPAAEARDVLPRWVTAVRQ